ncbi:MAG: hypothetical protein P3C10_05985 [Gemmatimonadota bacterium]|nr:hypothetical protein [Gemmatimonadota bacterium]
MKKAAAATLLEKLGTARVPQTYILQQFLAEKDFGWRIDSLRSRAAYAVSIAEAQKLVRTQGGLEPNELRTIPASYMIALTASKVEQKAGKDLMGGATIDVSANLSVSVYKLAFATSEAFGSALGSFYCEPGCTDKQQKQTAFSQFTVPFDHVASFSTSISGSAPEKDGVNGALGKLGEDVLDELITEMASAIPAFAVQEKIVAIDPPAARIGMKEGITPGARFFHFKSEQGADGATVQKQGAVLIAKKVADNRKTSFEREAVGGKVASIDSTTFSQVYPGGVGRGDMITEKPSDISIHGGVAFLGGKAGVLAEIRTEGLAGQLGLPHGARAIVGFKTFLQQLELDGIPVLDYRVQFIGAGAGYEFHPIRGKLRLMPLALYNFKVTAKTLDGESDDADDEGTAGIEVGADFGLRVTPTIELTGTLRNSSYIDVLGEGKTGMVVGFGLRLQRGRWGF